MRSRYIIIITFIVLTACNENKKKGIIPRDDFITILTELHTYDAVGSDYSIKSQLKDIDSATLYNSIFAKYNTDKAMFDSTMHWYSGQPEELAGIYDIVFGNLYKQNEELNEYSKLFEDSEENEIWNGPGHLNVVGDTAKYPEPYVIEIEEKGTYLFELSLRLEDDDQSESPYLVIYFFKDKDDTKPEERIEVCRSLIGKSNILRKYQYIFELEDDSYKYIKIIVPETPDRDSHKNKNLQIYRLKIY